MILDQALIDKQIQHNPVKDVTVPSNLPRQKRRFPTDEDLKIVSSHYEGFDFLPYFLLYTGLRSSEALAIDVEKDIDFEKKTITVNKHLIHDSNKPIIENITKTVDSERTVILLDRVAEKITKKKGLLFCNPDGTPYTFKNLVNNWYAYRKKYNTTVTAHQLRHGYATMLFEAGVNEKDAQELMGHSDITLTRQIYTHIRNKHKEETAEKLNNFNF
jgi:integrase